MKIGDFSLNWFDLAVVAVIAIGVIRGRSRGMSSELMDVLKWLLIVVVGGLIYRPAGKYLATITHLSPVTNYLMVYAFVVVVIRFVFGWLGRLVAEKLIGSDVFGSWEYYLGMAAGGTRFACYLLVAMAALNPAYLTPEQLAAQARKQRENFEDISFPTFGTLHHTVFTGSASGKFVKQYLGHELIVATASDRDSRPADSVRKQRERALDEVIGEK